MNIFTRFLQDERGFVLSAEAVLLGTVGVIGATVGLGAVAESVNDELTVPQPGPELQGRGQLALRSMGGWIAVHPDSCRAVAQGIGC